MTKLYESVNEIIEYHDKQEYCIWQNSDYQPDQDLVRLYATTIFTLIFFLEGQFKKNIWIVNDQQDHISRELQKEFKHQKAEYVNLTKILKYLDKILENSSSEQLNLALETIKQLQEHIVKPEIIIGIGFRNWYAHGGWDSERQKKIFNSESIELAKCQDLYRNVMSMCLDFEKHIFNRPEKL